MSQTKNGQKKGKESQKNVQQLLEDKPHNYASLASISKSWENIYKGKMQMFHQNKTQKGSKALTDKQRSALSHPQVSLHPAALCSDDTGSFTGFVFQHSPHSSGCVCVCV